MTKQKEKKLDHVRVIRYLRNWAKHNPFEASNLGGVTLVFDMDYITRTVAIRFSICSDKDNFDKALGLSTAVSTIAERILDLDNFRKLADIKGGFLDAYYAIMQAGIVDGTLSSREKVFLKKIDSDTFFDMRGNT